MRRLAAGVVLFLLPGAGRAESPAGWPLQAELLMAADAASYAPPDFKRQLVRNREQFMAGVRDAAAAEEGRRDAAQHLAAAARGAREVAKAIRAHTPFADMAYQAGGIVHEIAAASLLQAGGVTPEAGSTASRSSQFLGYPAKPFADPEVLAGSPPLAAGASPRAAYDAAVTRTTRLIAWIWKTAGGDASIVSRFP